MPQNRAMLGIRVKCIGGLTGEPSPSVLGDEGERAAARHLLTQGLPVVSLQEVPRSLEQVYLQAINAPDKAEVHRVE